MDFMCRNFIISYFFAVLSTNTLSQAVKECGGNAQCVVFDNCTGLYTPLTTDNAPSMLHLMKQLHCGFNEQRQPMICCPPVLSFAPVSSSSAPEAFDRAAALALLPQPDSCGIYFGNSMFGTITEFEEHPWLAMIRHDKFRDSRIYCGGVLISSRYVLTAAHCVDVLNLPQNGKATHVRLGEWSTSSVIDCVWGDCNQPPLEVPVEEVILHEDYAGHDGNQQNDIALLRLAYDVTFSDFVKPICLPIDTSLAQKTFEGYNLEVAGWGNTDTNQFLSAVKQKARLSVQNNSVCSQIYMMYDIDITEKHICAGKVFSEDPCTGDSGGPLMVKINGNSMVLGVESYSPSPCGTANRWPGVYTKVTAFVDWILSKLRP